jgi:flagellar motor switch protein FliM
MELINKVLPQNDSPTFSSLEQDKKDSRKYNFRKPNKFTKDQLRTLFMINENLSRILANFLSGYLRNNIDIKIESVEQATYEEFLANITSPVLLTVFQMSPLDGSAVIQTDNNFTSPVIDLLFGGSGTKNIQPKEFTEIELRVLKNLNQKILDNMATAWAGVFAIKPTVELMETNPQFNQIVSPNETVAIIALSTVITGHKSVMHLCFPWETLKEAIPNLTAQNWFAARKNLNISKSKDIENSLGKVPLSLSAYCGETRLTIQELLQLEVGDVILLDSALGEDMDLLVENHPKYKVQPGIVDDKLAIVVAGG